MNYPPLNMEIENIYAQIQASQYRSIAVTSANAGEGVTSVALALAQRNLLSGQSTLVIDLNLYHPSLQAGLELKHPEVSVKALGTPQLVSNQKQDITLMGITAPCDRATIMKLRKPGELEACIEECKQSYDTIIIDTTPLNRCNGSNIPAERIAAACDTALLVVLAGNTRETDVNDAVKRLKTAGADLAGCVINDKNNPPLKSELIRETKRLEPYLRRIAKYLQSIIKNNHFLGLAD